MSSKKVIDWATGAANPPKHQLMSILEDPQKKLGADAGICRQLGRIIRDLEEWQDR